MTVQEFNRSTLEVKANYINQWLAYPTGITNALVFQDYSIDFCCSINGQLISASAYTHTRTSKEAAQKMLQGGKTVVQILLDGLPDINKKVRNKMLKARMRNRMN